MRAGGKPKNLYAEEALGGPTGSIPNGSGDLPFVRVACAVRLFLPACRRDGIVAMKASSK